MVGEAWEGSGWILWNFEERPGANPDKISFFFETAGSPIRTEIKISRYTR